MLPSPSISMSNALSIHWDVPPHDVLKRRHHSRIEKALKMRHL